MPYTLTHAPTNLPKIFRHTAIRSCYMTTEIAKRQNPLRALYMQLSRIHTIEVLKLQSDVSSLSISTIFYMYQRMTHTQTCLYSNLTCALISAHYINTKTRYKEDTYTLTSTWHRHKTTEFQPNVYWLKERQSFLQTKSSFLYSRVIKNGGHWLSHFLKWTRRSWHPTSVKLNISKTWEIFYSLSLQKTHLSLCIYLNNGLFRCNMMFILKLCRICQNKAPHEI